MADIYTALQVSPRKKRCPPAFDDESVVTPKKLRTAFVFPRKFILLIVFKYIIGPLLRLLPLAVQ